MSTGVTSYAKLSELTTLYPFAGMEYVFTIGFLAFFILFFVWQTAMEQLHIRHIMGSAKAATPEVGGASLAPAE